MTVSTSLDELRSRGQIDCDTLDKRVAISLGPFVDCTSNQAIALGEIQKLGKESIIQQAVEVAKELSQVKTFSDQVSLAALAVEVMMVLLSARMTPHLTGYAHIQTNPYNAYSTKATIDNAKRIVQISTKLNPSFPASRLCIKIPGTWEGLQACRELERSGTHTLATTLFCMEQAALAADVGCTYIAPYVNELKAHFVDGFKDADKGILLSVTAQRYFERHASSTKVLAASFVAPEEVESLAGLAHMTVSPPLLVSLRSNSPSPSSMGTAFNKSAEIERLASVDYSSIIHDEANYRIAFTRSKSGASERKLSEAINIFADMQDALEALVNKHI